jgi:hypothetical protein
MGRSEVVKQLWVYIKANNLQVRWGPCLDLCMWSHFTDACAIRGLNSFNMIPWPGKESSLWVYIKVQNLQVRLQQLLLMSQN